MSDYNANYHFRRQLQIQGDCCCCNAFVWANFWLFLWLIGNVIELLWYAAMVWILIAPYNSVTWDCSGYDGYPDECDPRVIFEDAGFNDAWAITAVVVQCIIIILNVLGFVGLWNCISWMLLMIVIIGFINVVWCLVYWILALQYWYIFWLFVPILLLLFFAGIYQSARYHEKQALNRQYQRANNNDMQPV